MEANFASRVVQSQPIYVNVCQLVSVVSAVYTLTFVCFAYVGYIEYTVYSAYIVCGKGREQGACNEI